MAYAVVISPRVRKALRGLRPDVQLAFIAAIEGLEDDPHPPSSKPLNLKLPRHREWRVLYHIDNHQLVITAVDFGVRGDVYKRVKRNF